MQSEKSEILSPVATILILARSGSLSIENKNLACGPGVGGMSLVERAIRTAVDSLGQVRGGMAFENACVYSDDPDTLDLARTLGATAVPRPKDLCGAEQSSEEVVQAFIRNRRTVGLLEPDPICLYQLTSPFVTVDDLLRTLDVYQEERYDSAVTASKFFRFLGLGGTTNVWEQMWPKGRPRRQEMASVWQETGMLYLAPSSAWMKGSRFGESPGIVKISDPNRCIEVDELNDLLAAQALSAAYDI